MTVDGEDSSTRTGLYHNTALPIYTLTIYPTDTNNTSSATGHLFLRIKRQAHQGVAKEGDSMAAFDQNLSSVVDTIKYPIHDMGCSAMQEVLKNCHDRLQLDGSCVIPGFIRKDVINSMCAEVNNLPGGFMRDKSITAFQNRLTNRSTEGLDDNHPFKRLWPQKVVAVANDIIPTESMLNQVYTSSAVKRFLAKIVEKDNIYAYADEFQALNVMYMPEGGERTWHYDGSDFVVTLSLQKAEEGGRFEFAPFIRGPDDGSNPINELQQCEDEHVDDIIALWDGTYKREVKNLLASPGDLVVFNGMRSLHHVTPVKGKTIRINAVLSYSTLPVEEQVCGNEEVNVKLYGDRVKRIYEQRRTASQ